MQYNNKDYKPKLHDRWRALTVKNPYATQLVTAACSSANPVIAGYESGVTLGLVELYDVKPVAEFTPEDWENTRIPPEKRKSITKGFGWMMRNPRRVVEFPIKGQLGIYNLVYTKGEIIQYPRKMVIDKKSWEQIKKQNRYE